LGAEVNLASRLESNAKIDAIFISSATNLLIGDKFMTDSVGNITVKGFAEPVSVYQVLGPRNAASQERRYSNLNIDGFSLYLDLDSMPNYNQKKAYEALVEAASKVKKFQDK
jgi:adenylate cyclase